MKEKTFEQALARIEEISEILESGQTALDESLVLFEEVNELSRFCRGKLDEAEKKVQLLVKDESKLSTMDADFE
jgi:exodeoxyribonuclease VII small subunit